MIHEIMKARLKMREKEIRSVSTIGQTAATQSAPTANHGLSTQVSARTSIKKTNNRLWVFHDSMNSLTML